MASPSYFSSNLLCYYEADQGVSLDLSNKVSQWNDLSGNGNHLTQATEGLRPGYSATSFNGKPAVVLTSASGAFMSASPTIAAGAPTISLFVVVRANAAPVGAFNGICCLGSGVVGGQTTTIGGTNSGLVWFGGAGYGDPSFDAITNNSYWALGKTTVNRGGFGVDSPFVNNVKKAPFTQGAAYSLSPANTFLFGKYVTGSTTGNWDVALVAAWNRVLADNEFRALTAYAKAKFGLAFTVDSRVVASSRLPATDRLSVT